ncbi:MAG: glycine--tRNA ligase subunit beta [Firmicutes bacterium]|nr:glycine--tRNA ligase subunit beta [Bacillota bacterium]
MSKEAFLLEIGTEEIPARFMAPALQQFKENFSKEMQSERLAHGEIALFGTPRRLAILVADVAEQQQDLHEKKKGPAVKAAYDADGNPSKAALGFARSQGVNVADLFTEEVAGVPYIFALRSEEGRDVLAILPDVCERLIRSLTFPKPMFWYSKDIRFARPIRWLTALWGSEKISFSFAGLESGNVTYGHRFLAPARTVVPAAATYADVMRQSFVMADPAEREACIVALVQQAAAQLGGHATLDEDLLAEVVNLVEYPRAVTGTFAQNYLEVPQEVLITAMRAHQRYFPVFDANEHLMPYFITISNGTKEEYEANVRAGNERVLRARLADARFFFDEDRKKPLDAYVDALDTIIFMEPLGSMRKKTARLMHLVQTLADELQVTDPIKETAQRAALLAKADLVTHMVYEFPELQGTMGMHYARLSGESNDVASAIEEHYAPRFANDKPAVSLAGALVALADKMDTIASSFALGMIPTSSQDPYALRRSASGVISTLAAHNLSISMPKLSALALVGLANQMQRPQSEVQSELENFLIQRIRYNFAEQGLRYDVIDAVLAGTTRDLPGLWQRAQVLQTKLASPELTWVLTPFTRVANLTRDFVAGAEVDSALFINATENDLYQAVLAAQDAVDIGIARADFADVFSALFPLYNPIERFFTDVMVMVEDASVRQNRLLLLSLVKDLFFTLGDISKIVQEKK